MFGSGQQKQEGGVLGSLNEKRRYQMRQQMIAIGDDYWVTNEQGEKVFKVDGKVLRIRKTLIFEDAQGRELCQIQQRLLRIRETMEVTSPRGESLATVKKALIAPFRDRWSVTVPGSANWTVQGNIFDHEYTISQGGTRLAEISRKWFRLTDTYGVEVEPGRDDIIVLAVTVCIDSMTGKKEKPKDDQ